jgi:hypothetical protein
MTERENTQPVPIDAGITLPRIYAMGYPNPNCIGCVKSSSPTYWNHVRNVHSAVFTSRADQRRRVNTKLIKYKGQRIFLYELPTGQKGRPMKSMDFEMRYLG